MDAEQQDALVLTDRELLLETYRMTKDCHKALYGNGRPGIIDRVGRLEAKQTATQAVGGIFAILFAGAATFFHR